MHQRMRSLNIHVLFVSRLPQFMCLMCRISCVSCCRAHVCYTQFMIAGAHDCLIRNVYYGTASIAFLARYRVSVQQQQQQHDAGARKCRQRSPCMSRSSQRLWLCRQPRSYPADLQSRPCPRPTSRSARRRSTSSLLVTSWATTVATTVEWAV